MWLPRPWQPFFEGNGNRVGQRDSSICSQRRKKNGGDEAAALYAERCCLRQTMLRYSANEVALCANDVLLRKNCGREHPFFNE